MSEAQLQELAATLEALSDRKRYNKLEFFRPYPKQLQFLAAETRAKETALIAGNQNGKSETGAFKMATHLTGKYPPWWPGRKFTHPIRSWADGVTSLLVRDVSQAKLCGKPGVTEDFGTGYIPKEDIVDVSLARGVTDAYDTVQVKHYRSDGTPDGTSTVTFKSYEQGRLKHQGEPVDLIWCDEEPPQDVYSEIVTRTTATKGSVYCTFTPLQGMTEVVQSYLECKDATKIAITMTIEDAEHIAPEERAAIISAWPAHEREARAKGVPMLGSGRIFPYSEEAIREPAIEHVPAYWGKLWSVDFGIDHPFAAVLYLHDRDNDTLHVHHCIRIADQLPIQHAAALLRIGANVPVAWPHDGNQRRDAGNGTTETLAAQYRRHKVKMLGTHATFPDGGYSTEAGIMGMQEFMSQGRFKVAEHLSEWFEEFRMYHRKDGLIVKVRDDLMSASRIGFMQRRSAQNVALGNSTFKRRTDGMARDVDYDLFG